jgi:hypothetical protein
LEQPTDYTGNSRKQKQIEARAEKAEKKIDPVVRAEDVVVKKPSIGYRMKTTFFGGDFRSAAAFVTADVLLPALRDILVNIITKGGESVIYGDRYSRGRGGYTGRTQYNYSSPIHRDPRDNRAPLPDQPRMQRRIGRASADIILSTRGQAESVLEGLNDIIDKYDVASVADLRYLLDLPSSSVDNKFGWGFLRNVEIRQTRDGWLLDLPPEQEI